MPGAVDGRAATFWNALLHAGISRVGLIFGILPNDQHGTVSVRRAGSTHGAHDLAEKSPMTPPAYNQKLGVPALLDENLRRGADLHGSCQILRTVLSKSSFDGLFHEAPGDGLQLCRYLQIARGQVGRKVEVRPSETGYDVNRGVKGLGDAPGQLQSRRGVLGTVNTDNDALVIVHGVQTARVQRAGLGPKVSRPAHQPILVRSCILSPYVTPRLRRVFQASDAALCARPAVSPPSITKEAPVVKADSSPAR